MSQYLPSAASVAYELASVSGGTEPDPRTRLDGAGSVTLPAPSSKPIFVIVFCTSQPPRAIIDAAKAVLTELAVAVRKSMTGAVVV